MAHVMSAPTAETVANKQHQPARWPSTSHRSTAESPIPMSSAQPRPIAPVEPAMKRMIPFETRWDVTDVAAYLKCSTSWVYKAAEKGWLPCERYGGLLRFDPEAIRSCGKGAAA